MKRLLLVALLALVVGCGSKKGPFDEAKTEEPAKTEAPAKAKPPDPVVKTVTVEKSGTPAKPVITIKIEY
jgi:hypothetical protein